MSEQMETLGKGCQKLKHLTLGNCSRLDDSGVFAFVQNCRDLGYLELQSKNILHKSIVSMSEQFPIETYLINLLLARRDSTDAALKL
jgi:hypothetical protein